MHDSKKVRFNSKADTALAELYHSVGAKTAEEKANAIKLAMGGDFTHYAAGGQVSDEMILGCLEYEYLSNAGLIDLVLA